MSTQVPPLKESLESVPMVKLSKDSIRLSNYDGSWNKEGIMEAFDNTEDRMFYCTVTGTPLFYLTLDDKMFKLETFGFCALNGKPYHFSQLAIPDNVQKESYPVQYSGYYSLDEFNKPLTDEESRAIMKEYKI